MYASLKRGRHRLLGVAVLSMVMTVMSCATSSGSRSNQKPQVASKATLDRLRAQRDALKKEVRALRKSTAKTTRKVSSALGKISMSGTGIGAINTDASRTTVKWSTSHAGVQVKGTLKADGGNAEQARGSIVLRKGGR